MKVTQHCVVWEFVGWQRCVSDGRNALNLGGLIGIGGLGDYWGILVQLYIPAGDVSYSMLLVSVSLENEHILESRLIYLDFIRSAVTDMHLRA